MIISTLRYTSSHLIRITKVSSELCDFAEEDNFPFPISHCLFYVSTHSADQLLCFYFSILPYYEILCNNIFMNMLMYSKQIWVVGELN